uniref:Uncharacterized protein n=1 Tax=Trypanosoma congolense (strain IL3000) TaxID=1068625 RepID=G0UZR8_TRYCI|nr:conserved hypothetical protein [Trypanosoma congolense IL3000]
MLSSFSEYRSAFSSESPTAGEPISRIKAVRQLQAALKGGDLFGIEEAILIAERNARLTAGKHSGDDLFPPLLRRCRKALNEHLEVCKPFLQPLCHACRVADEAQLTEALGRISRAPLEIRHQLHMYVIRAEELRRRIGQKQRTDSVTDDLSESSARGADRPLLWRGRAFCPPPEVRAGLSEWNDSCETQAAAAQCSLSCPLDEVSPTRNEMQVSLSVCCRAIGKDEEGARRVIERNEYENRVRCFKCALAEQAKHAYMLCDFPQNSRTCNGVINTTTELDITLNCTSLCCSTEGSNCDPEQTLRCASPEVLPVDRSVNLSFRSTRVESRPTRASMTPSSSFSSHSLFDGFD